MENLRQKRQGYVDTRVNDWQEVRTKTAECATKISKLENKVNSKTHDTEKLGEEIDMASLELHANLENHKNTNRTSVKTLEDLTQQIRFM